jgi:hypothetical protein
MTPAMAAKLEQISSRILPEFAARWCLVLAEDPADIAILEAITCMSQAEAVDSFIEESCWSEELPEFVGGKRSPGDRRAALITAYNRQNASC